MISWSLLFYITEWIIRIIMLGVVPQRRRPSSAMAWLLIIFFAPEIGLILYVLIGRNRLPRSRVRRHAHILSYMNDVHKRFSGHPNIVRPNLGAESMAAVKLAEQLGEMPILGGNDVELIDQTDTVIERLIADIDAARHHVHLLFYIYANDNTGRQVAEALQRAVQRGVQCRLLADAVGSRPFFKSLAEQMRRQGVEVYSALPVNPFRRRVSRMDVRNHRKIAVIDGQIGYTGSQNIVDAGYGHKDLQWHDLMIRLVGPGVMELQAVFMEDWYFETQEVLDSEDIFPGPERVGQIPIQTLPSGPNYPVENYQRMVVAAVYAAHRRVVITTPYFVPDEALIQALQVAVLRGVDVKLILPRRNNMILVNAAAESYFEELLEAGIQIYLFEPGLLHAKTMSIDHTVAFIGSSNFDIRSFALNFEINLVLYGSQITDMLREHQNAYIARSSRLELVQWQQRSKGQRIWQNTARLLSPLL